MCALSLRLLLQLSISLDSTNELLSRSRKRHVLDSEVDALLDVPVLDLLVYDNTDCALCDVVDNTGLAMIDLMRHTTDDQQHIPHGASLRPHIGSRKS